jgi:hypothetical protein
MALEISSDAALMPFSNRRTADGVKRWVGPERLMAATTLPELFLIGAATHWNTLKG